MSACHETYCAPPERVTPDELQRQVALFRSIPLTELLDAVGEVVLVLNTCRQVVHANRNLLSLLGLQEAAHLFGQRPGEVLQCEHACEGPNGCGTAEGCRPCGALQSILAGIGGERVEGECRITRTLQGRLSACDFKVCATPMTREGDHFVILSMSDISHEKRRSALERIFFHDLLNMAGGLRSISGLLVEDVPLDVRADMLLVHRYATALVEEILAQRVLVAAENDELGVELRDVQAREVLRDVIELYRTHEACIDKRLVMEPCGGHLLISTDRVLLARVLGNLVKNALEASPRGGVVTAGCEATSSGVTFRVHNAGFISPEVRAQMFQRSFSTKGQGRGLGMYGVRLLTGNYLGGRVECMSSRDSGTTLLVILPRYLKHRQDGKERPDAD